MNQHFLILFLFFNKYCENSNDGPPPSLPEELKVCIPALQLWLLFTKQYDLRCNFTQIPLMRG